MYPDLKSRIAIVTGASRGIGRAIALHLSSEGVRLLIVARSGNQLQEVADACASEVLTLPIDLRESDAPQRVVQMAIDRFGSLDAIVNNAGATKRGDFLELSDDDWQDGFALKFFCAARCSRAAWPHLQASRGTITNVIGIGGHTASAEFTIGGSVNAALMNLTKALADRGIKDGIRVNAVNPGSIATQRLQARIDSYVTKTGLAPSEAKAAMAAELGITRFGEPAEIASVVAFLMSSGASFCQGSIIDVDGGQTHTI